MLPIAYLLIKSAVSTHMVDSLISMSMVRYPTYHKVYFLPVYLTFYDNGMRIRVSRLISITSYTTSTTTTTTTTTTSTTKTYFYLLLLTTTTTTTIILLLLFIDSLTYKNEVDSVLDVPLVGE